MFDAACVILFLRHFLPISDKGAPPPCWKTTYASCFCCSVVSLQFDPENTPFSWPATVEGRRKIAPTKKPKPPKALPPPAPPPPRVVRHCERWVWFHQQHASHDRVLKTLDDWRAETRGTSTHTCRADDLYASVPSPFAWGASSGIFGSKRSGSFLGRLCPMPLSLPALSGSQPSSEAEPQPEEIVPRGSKIHPFCRGCCCRHRALSAPPKQLYVLSCNGRHSVRGGPHTSK